MSLRDSSFWTRRGALVAGSAAVILAAGTAAALAVGGGSRALEQIVFSPSGGTAYVTAADGLWVFNTVTERVTAVIRDLGDLRGIVLTSTPTPGGS